jgi:hypothetical protein
MAWKFRERLAGLLRDRMPPGHRARHEPAGAVQEALAQLRRLSARGVVVPAELSSAVLAARQELVANEEELSPATGLAFYDARCRLAYLLARSVDDRDAPLADSFSRAAVNSEFMLKFAAESGTAVPADVQIDLLAGQFHLSAPVSNPPIPSEQFPGDQVPSDQVKMKFYSAYAVLAKLLGNVTADTIKACRSPLTHAALKRDEKRAIGWALVTLVMSVLLFTAAAIDKQLTEEIATANDLAIKIRGNVFPPVASGAAPATVPEVYLHDPCTAIASTPAAGEFVPRSQAELDQIQNFAIAVRGARTRANKLNGFILNSECDPFDHCWWNAIGHNERVDKMLAPDATPTMRDRFELNPALSNYTAEFLCKVQTWQEIRNFATNVEKSYAATSGGVVAYALPILYALLGAYAYRLRQFSETVRNRTYHPSFADSARLITALIAGAVTGLFNTARDLSVSPLAAAFLIGYGVEIFFRFLDATLSAYGLATPSNTSASSSAGQAGNQGAGAGHDPVPVQPPVAAHSSAGDVTVKPN